MRPRPPGRRRFFFLKFQCFPPDPDTFWGKPASDPISLRLFAPFYCINTMRRRLPWLLATATTALLCLPAEAAKLERWQFDAQNNHLEFSTDVTVQPRAQMLFNPTRVVVDLPGVKLKRPKSQKSGSGAIRQIRLGQFTKNTARLVVEVAPGWTLDPSKVTVKGTSRRDWRLELPQPEREQSRPGSSSSVPVSQAPSQQQPVSQSPVAQTPISQTSPSLNPNSSPSLLAADILQVRSTSDGLFIKTAGRVGQLKLERSRDRRSFTLNITEARLKGAIRLPNQAELARLGIQSMGAITLPFQAGRPTTTRITLNVPADAVDWKASRSGDSGIVLLPKSQPTALNSPAPTPSTTGSSGGTTSSSNNGLPPGAEAISITLPPGPPPSARPPVVSRPPINRPPTNGRVLVVIDPGHGGPDPGAVGRGGLRETDINLDVSRKLVKELEAAGIQTLITRTGEYDLDLQPRVNIAERANATIFVSIHSNAISLNRPDVNGVETYYYDSGKQLADTIHRSIIGNTKSSDRGVRKARFYVLTRTSMPAVLVETGFVTGAQDAINLSSSSFRSQMAAAIARGIRNYLGR